MLLDAARLRTRNHRYSGRAHRAFRVSRSLDVADSRARGARRALPGRPIGRIPEMMTGTVLDILIYVFDRYMLDEVPEVPEREHLARDLERVGFAQRER